MARRTKRPRRPKTRSMGYPWLAVRGHREARPDVQETGEKQAEEGDGRVDAVDGRVVDQQAEVHGEQ